MAGKDWLATAEISEKTSLSKVRVRAHLGVLIKEGQVEDNGKELKWKRYRLLDSNGQNDQTADSATAIKSSASIN